MSFFSVLLLHVMYLRDSTTGSAHLRFYNCLDLPLHKLEAFDKMLYNEAFELTVLNWDQLVDDKLHR